MKYKITIRISILSMPCIMMMNKKDLDSCSIAENNDLVTKYFEAKIQPYGSGHHKHRYDNVTLGPLLLPVRVMKWSHSTYGSSARRDSHQAVFVLILL
jgi:hypothetical protein